MSSQSSTASNQSDASSTRLDAIYRIMVTPVIFVSFLASLAWVDFRYSLMRSHSHSESRSRMPGWLHQALCREAPYQYVRVDSNNPGTPGPGEGEGSRWYYHSKQRKLMKMEVEDAFQIRGSVLVVLGLLAAVGTWAAWRVGCWMWDAFTTRYG